MSDITSARRTVAAPDLPADSDLPGWWREAVELRRHIHRHPELRFLEHQTANLLSRRLADAGFEIVVGVGGTGVVARLTRGEGPTVTIRADMDALPLTEATDVEYRSTKAGVMHACGHDVHMAVVVTAAERLAASQDWAGTLIVLLQPAEEIPYGEASGARAILDSGAIDFETVDAVLGVHCWPWLPVGAIGIDPKVAMASKDAFRIEMLGSTTHAAAPADGRDALLAMSHLVTTLHNLVFRRIDPSDQVAFNVGSISGLFGQSIVADHVEVIGTLRTLDEGVRARLLETIENATRGTATAHDCQGIVHWANQMPSVRNNANLVSEGWRLLEAVVGIDVVEMESTPMTTDDFALYAEQTPGLYVKLGTSGGSITPLHSSTFDVDERAIWAGVAAIEALVRGTLAPSQ